MVQERPRQFGGVARYNPPSQVDAVSSSPQVSRATQLGLGLGGAGKGGKGFGGKFMKRHRKIPRDTIHGITTGDIRRLARRGGVKRISALVYDDVRAALRQRLEVILKQACALVDSRHGKTVSVRDVIWVLNRLGIPIYGFDSGFRN